MKFGKCELCKQMRDLHDSHYAPKGGYKKNRADQITNPNPIAFVNGKAKQTSTQIRDFKFCTECEKRFNVGGESYVNSLIPEYGKDFKLHKVLTTSRMERGLGGHLLFPAAKIPEVDLDRLIYFGMSMFWRGTRTWPPADGASPPRLLMNLRQEKAIRKFLLGHGPLPRDLAIMVAVWPFNQVSPAFLMPNEEAGLPRGRYWFYYGGLIYRLALGKDIPHAFSEMCAYHKKVMSLSKELGESVHNALKAMVGQVDKSSITKTLKEVEIFKAQSPIRPSIHAPQAGNGERN
jgi:hypothetical protein